MSAVVTMTDGSIRQLDRAAAPNEVVSPEDAGDTRTLGRLLTRILSELGAVRRRFTPNRIDFRGIVSTGSAIAPYVVRLNHGFGGQVLYWPVRHRALGTVTLALMQVEEDATNDNTLVLKIYYEGTIDIRVEEAG